MDHVISVMLAKLFPPTAESWIWSKTYSGQLDLLLFAVLILNMFRRFNNEYCPKLKGKPKFFIIQVWKGFVS